MTGRNSAVSSASPPKPPSKSSRNALHPTTRKRPRETLRPVAPRTRAFGVSDYHRCVTGVLTRGSIGTIPETAETENTKLAGAEDGNRQMVDILTAVLTDGLPSVEAACAEAIAQGVHSADVVLNILSRQRDPGPPATLLTPAALTLRHAPIADCARYDNLRRIL